ncbi:MAG: DUF1080 domain-containing protein [Planctomycetes bacterium]|nr:DUF1080 domain-containing protein [Planctomycetota bacterium]
MKVLCLTTLAMLVSAPAWADDPAPKGKDAESWTSLFDGKTLQGWKSSEFGGQGEPRVEDGKIVLPMGADLTGIRWAGEHRTMDYELSLEAVRIDGNDFFCGLTFPVGDDPCSLIVGGWGGSLVGLSSLDGFDASENETSQVLDFEKNRWYKVRLRVTKPKIEVWLDGKQIIDVETEGRRISIRIEVERSRPLGIASWCTTAALRDIKVRPVTGPATPVQKP